MTKSPSHPGYPVFLAALKERILHARTSAAYSVNTELVRLYWDIGRAIVEKQQSEGWGEAVVERLAGDLLDEFPDMRGFSRSNLWRMRQIYLDYTATEFLAQPVREMDRSLPIPKPRRGKAILAQPVRELGFTAASGNSPAQRVRDLRDFVAQIPWGHHVELLAKVKAPAARLYYLRATAQLGWSRSVLLNQIKARAFERARREKKTHNFELALPEHFAEQAGEMMKSRYNLEFLGLGRAMKERELENRLIERLQQFILELGYGFCFVGRQHRLALGRKEYFVDLLFYHRFLKTLVAFDLKIGSFEPEHAGKMDFYLNLLNDRERAPEDQPSIGIILCAEKDDIEVEYALKSKQNPIGVAEYRTQPEPPARYKGRLPSPKQLTTALRNILESEQ